MRSGCLYIDGVDVYLRYGVYVIEGGWNELLSYPPLKAVTCNDWQEEDGVEADLSAPVLDTREVTLKFAIAGAYDRYLDFLALLSDSAVHTFRCPEIGRTFRLRLTRGGNADLALRLGLFSLRFADDYPLDGYTYAAPTGGGVPPGDDYTLDGARFTDYGVRILQGAASEIMKPPDVKTAMLRNIPTQAGAIYDTAGGVTYKAKDVRLSCLLRASDLPDMWRNYHALLHDLTKPDERSLGVTELEAELPCHYKRSSVSEFAVGVDGRPWVKFSLTLTLVRDFRIISGGGVVLVTEDGIPVVTEDGANLIALAADNNTNNG